MHKIKLNELPVNKAARVCEISGDSAPLRRIRSLGITEGAEITPLFRSPFKDPTAYLVKDCVIALRSSDCEKILVHPLSNNDRARRSI